MIEQTFQKLNTKKTRPYELIFIKNILRKLQNDLNEFGKWRQNLPLQIIQLNYMDKEAW